MEKTNGIMNHIKIIPIRMKAICPNAGEINDKKRIRSRVGKRKKKRRIKNISVKRNT